MVRKERNYKRKTPFYLNTAQQPATNEDKEIRYDSTKFLQWKSSSHHSYSTLPWSMSTVIWERKQQGCWVGKGKLRQEKVDKNERECL